MVTEWVGFKLVDGELVKLVLEEERGLRHNRQTEPTEEEWGAFVYGRNCGLAEALGILAKPKMPFAQRIPRLVRLEGQHGT